MIESISNPQIKKIMKLNKNAKYRRQEQAFVAEGWKTVGEALARGVVTTLYVSERFMDTWQDELREVEGEVWSKVAHNIDSHSCRIRGFQTVYPVVRHHYTAGDHCPGKNASLRPTGSFEYRKRMFALPGGCAGSGKPGNYDADGRRCRHDGTGPDKKLCGSF